MLVPANELLPSSYSQNWPKSAIEAIDWSTVTAISNPELNLAILRRLGIDFHEAVEELVTSNFRGHQLIFERGMDPDLICAELDEVLNLANPQALSFYADIRDIAVRFMALADETEIGIKIEAAAGQTCKYFHCDRVALRLVTTYFGPGSDWLANTDVDRSYLGSRDNDKILKSGAVVRQMNTFDIGIMKGDLFPGNQGQALVHRSPKVPDKLSKRLLVRMDTLSHYVHPGH